MNQEIRDNYLSPHPTSFSSPGNLKRVYGNRFTGNEIENTLQHVDCYTLHKDYREPRQRNPFYVFRCLQQLHIDLIDVRSLAKYNDKINWLLVAIDAFSKYAWVKAMVTKSAASSKAALKHLLEEDLAGKQVESIFADHGTEWTNRVVRAYLASQNIRLDLALSETKAAIA